MKPLLRVYIQSELAPKKDVDPDKPAAGEWILKVEERPAEAPSEASPASGTPVPESWPPLLGCCLPVVVHTG